MAPDEPWMQALPFKYRTCDACHAALSLPMGLGSASILSPGAFFPASPSIGGSASPLVGGSDAGASEMSELSECPVCGSDLPELGGRSEQEEHVKECLETGGGAIASNGRYLGTFSFCPSAMVFADGFRLQSSNFLLDHSVRPRFRSARLR